MRATHIFLALISAALMTSSSAVFAQSPPKIGTMHMTCNVGSFRLINGTGKVDFDFKGTVLISYLEGKVTPTGNIRQEWDKNGKKAYFGSGHMTVEGHFRFIQWFGQNLKLNWTGNGRAMLYGEYDQNLDTGFVWYDETNHRRTWNTGGITVDLPEPRQLNAPPTMRGGGKQ